MNETKPSDGGSAAPYPRQTMTDDRISERKYWLVLGALTLALVVAELLFNDILIDSATQELTSTMRVLVVLATGGTAALILTGVMRRYLISQGTVDERDSKQSSRALSVLPLIRAILISFNVVVAGLVALSELGVDIGPILAGAGVAGLVLGMGAQSLLKDILAGIFFVLDDAFRLGEYVEIGETRGTVEKISLRSMQIRHHRGALQTLPYGAIQSVKNLSRDWVITKLEFQVPHDTDILEIKKIVKALSQDIQEDEVFGPQLLAPVKFQGISNVDLYGLTVRIKFTTRPGDQFLIRREVYRLVQEKFAENGIEFAQRTVKVDTPESIIAHADDVAETTAKNR